MSSIFIVKRKKWHITTKKRSSLLPISQKKLNNICLKNDENKFTFEIAVKAI